GIGINRTKGLLFDRIGHLVEVVAQGGYQSKLIVWRGVKDQRTKAADAVSQVVEDDLFRRFQATVGAVGIDARVVSEALGMAPEGDLTVGLIESAIGGGNFGVVTEVKARTRDNVENAVGAVTVVGGVAAALDFEIVDILRIKLRTHIARDAGVGHGHAVDQPADLRAAANMESIGNHVGGRNKVRDHLQAVRAIRARRISNFRASDERLRCGAFRFDLTRHGFHFYSLTHGSKVEGKVQHWRAAGIH